MLSGVARREGPRGKGEQVMQVMQVVVVVVVRRGGKSGLEEKYVSLV